LLGANPNNAAKWRPFSKAAARARNCKDHKGDDWSNAGYRHQAFSVCITLCIRPDCANRFNDLSAQRPQRRSHALERLNDGGRY
jgi:hypothetical protein